MNVKQKRKGVLACLFSAAVCLPGLVSAASLPDSHFEIDDDANFVVDGAAPAIDWVSTVGMGLTVVEDEPTGSDDDSFKGGTKEDSEDPQTTTGSIPNNKSDLKQFGVWQESNGGDFLHLFWTRVQDPSGTTLMDFEFNAGNEVYAPTATGAQFPVREAGDLLIEYKLSQGGVTPELFMYTWLTAAEPGNGLCEASNSFPCWGDQINLSAAGIAIGSINTSAADSGAVGIGSFDPYTFGEASIDLSQIFPEGECQSFGFASLKSRSSDSFSAQMKDFIAPYPVNISNCANINIKKTDDSEPPVPLAGAEFTLYYDNGNTAGVFDAADELVTDVNPVVTGADGTAVWIDIFAGAYCVVETQAPPGHSIPADPDNYECVVVTADADLSLSFTNPRVPATVNILKLDDATPPNVLAGAEFTLYNDLDVVGVFDGSDTSTGKMCTTNGSGVCSIENILPPGNYCVVETVTPAGHDTADPECFSLMLAQTVNLEFVDPRQPARVNILKKDDDDPASLLSGAEFTLYNDLEVVGVFDGADTSTGKTCTTDVNGECSIDNILPPGNYCLVETVTPTGYDTADPQCISLSLNETVDLVFIDPRQPAKVIITKKDDDSPANLLTGAEFTLYNDLAVVGVFDGSDTATGKTCTTDGTGECTIDNILPPGNYCLVETVTPAGYATADPQCVSLALNQTLELTFIDPRLRGAIRITKTRKHAADGPGDHPHAGVTFAVSGDGLAEPIEVVTDDNGQACVDGLLLSEFFGGNYSVTETLPTGYAPDGDLTKFVTVDNVASCSDSPYVGEEVAFANTPLSNITVTFESQVVGGTAAKIDCYQENNPMDATPDAFDDISETSINLKPGTYTCVVVVDP